MRKVEARMIQAIRELIERADFDGTLLKVDNTTVSQSHHGIAHTPGYERIISVRLHGNEIAAIRPAEATLWVSDCGWRTATTKSRLNILIGAFTRHTGISQVKGEWLRIMDNGARYAWPASDVFPLCLDVDNYYLQRAAELSR